MLLTGCGTATRDITPWLRTTTHTQFELIAESGSHPDNWMHAERKIAGIWREIPVETDFGFSLADDTRAVLGGQLMTEDGRTIPLDCDTGDEMHLRASPDGRHLICVMRPEVPRDPAADTNLKAPEPPIDITSRDLNGVVEWRRRVAAPIRMPEGTPAMTKDVFTSFLGFIPAGLVFSVEVVDYVHPTPTNLPSICTAYVLGRDDSWRKIGSLEYGNAERWKCNFPAPWTDVLGYEVVMGKYARGTDGQPDPK